MLNISLQIEISDWLTWIRLRTCWRRLMLQASLWNNLAPFLIQPQAKRNGVYFAKSARISSQNKTEASTSASQLKVTANLIHS